MPYILFKGAFRSCVKVVRQKWYICANSQWNIFSISYIIYCCVLGISPEYSIVRIMSCERMVMWTGVCVGQETILYDTPDSKAQWANMGLTWVLSAPDGPNVGLMNFATWDETVCESVGQSYWCLVIGVYWVFYELFLPCTVCLPVITAFA